MPAAFCVSASAAASSFLCAALAAASSSSRPPDRRKLLLCAALAAASSFFASVLTDESTFFASAVAAALAFLVHFRSLCELRQAPAQPLCVQLWSWTQQQPRRPLTGPPQLRCPSRPQPWPQKSLSGLPTSSRWSSRVFRDLFPRRFRLRKRLLRCLLRPRKHLRRRVAPRSVSPNRNGLFRTRATSAAARFPPRQRPATRVISKAARFPPRSRSSPPPPDASSGPESRLSRALPRTRARCAAGALLRLGKSGLCRLDALGGVRADGRKRFLRLRSALRQSLLCRRPLPGGVLPCRSQLRAHARLSPDIALAVLAASCSAPFCASCVREPGERALCARWPLVGRPRLPRPSRPLGGRAPRRSPHRLRAAVASLSSLRADFSAARLLCCLFRRLKPLLHRREVLLGRLRHGARTARRRHASPRPPWRRRSLLRFLHRSRSRRSASARAALASARAALASARGGGRLPGPTRSRPPSPRRLMLSPRPTMRLPPRGRRDALPTLRPRRPWPAFRALVRERAASASARAASASARAAWPPLCRCYLAPADASAAAAVLSTPARPA